MTLSPSQRVVAVEPDTQPVLAALGLDFDRVIGDDRQMDLLSVLNQS